MERTPTIARILRLMVIDYEKWSLAPRGEYRVVTMAFDPRTARPEKQKAPSCDGASATYRSCCLPAEAVHQPTLQPQIILLCAAKVRVQILRLDRAERQVAGQLEIGAAAKRHREGIHRARRKARRARRRGFSAQQHLHVGSKPAGVVIGQPRTEQVVD